MEILVMKIKLRAAWVKSLKEKRMILLSITKRISNKFNVSVAEVGEQNVHEIIVIGICTVGTSSDILHSMKEKILDFVEDNTDAELIDIEEEQITY